MPFQLKGFDAYTKSMDGIQVKTIGGAIVTVVSGLLMFYLFVSEFMFYRTVSTSNHLFVDQTRSNSKIPIDMDIVFPAITCSAIHVDAQDSKGEQQLEVHDAIIQEPWVLTNEKGERTEGCRVHGTLHVNKVQGSVHFALGKGRATTHHGGHQHHVHQFSMRDLVSFNTSHSVMRLSFGPDFPGLVNPLNGVSKSVEKGSEQFQYFLKVVPTQYTPLSGATVHSHQYSLTERRTAIDLGSGQFVQPGVFLRYEFSPIMVELAQTRRSFLQFLTSACAIVGGVFTVAGMLDATIFASSKMLSGKSD